LISKHLDLDYFRPLENWTSLVFRSIWYQDYVNESQAQMKDIVDMAIPLGGVRKGQSFVLKI
jgi:hypothetical protein